MEHFRWNYFELKQCFQKKTMSPELQIESSSMLTALYCVTGWNPSNILRESMHKHNFGQTLKIQSAVVTLNIRSRSSKSYLLFLSANNVSMQVWCGKIHWFRRQNSEKADLQFLRTVTMIMRWPWKLGQTQQNHINSLFCHNDTIHKSLAGIHCSTQEIAYKNIS